MKKTVIRTDEAPSPIGPYSQAVQSGQLLFVSGQIATDASTGKMMLGSIEEETITVMSNIGAILKAVGLDFSHVLKTTIFLTSLEDFARLNAVYGKYFTDQPPARETVQVSRLPKDVHVEISCIASMG